MHPDDYILNKYALWIHTMFHALLFGWGKSVMTVMRFWVFVRAGERMSERENRRNGGCHEPSDSPDNEKHSLLRQVARPDDWSVRGISASIIFHQVKSTRLQPAKHSIDNCEPSLAEREREREREMKHPGWSGDGKGHLPLHTICCTHSFVGQLLHLCSRSPLREILTLTCILWSSRSCEQILQQVNKDNWTHMQRQTEFRRLMSLKSLSECTHIYHINQRCTISVLVSADDHILKLLASLWSACWKQII